MADGLRTQERGHRRLFDLAVREAVFGLGLARFLELAFEHGGPVVAAIAAGRAGGGRRQVARDAGQLGLAGGVQKQRRPRERSVVPRLGVAQRHRESAQNAPRALEPIDLRPLRIENLGNIRMERVTREDPRLHCPGLLARVGIDRGHVLYGGDRVRSELLRARNRIRLEKAPAQHLGHVVFSYRLNGLFLLAVHPVGDRREQLPAERIVLLRIGSEKRGHDGAFIRRDRGLAEILEKIRQHGPPLGVCLDLVVRVYQDFVYQHERRQPAPLRPSEEIGQQRLGRRGFAFGVRAFGMDEAESFRPRNLERKDAPRMQQPAALARRPQRLEALFHVDLVET